MFSWYGARGPRSKHRGVGRGTASWRVRARGRRRIGYSVVHGSRHGVVEVDHHRWVGVARQREPPNSSSAAKGQRAGRQVVVDAPGDRCSPGCVAQFVDQRVGGQVDEAQRRGELRLRQPLLRSRCLLA